MNPTEIAIWWLKTGEQLPPMSHEGAKSVFEEIGRLATKPKWLRVIEKYQELLEWGNLSEENRNKMATVMLRAAVLGSRYLEKHPGEAPFYAGPPAMARNDKYLLLLIFRDSGLTVGQINFLLATDLREIPSLLGNPYNAAKSMLLHTEDFMDFTAEPNWERIDLPPELRVDLEAKQLAHAFEKQMIAKAKEANRPPIIGDFVMRNPDLPALDDIGFDHIRLIIKPSRIWVSYIFSDGASLPGWWSPNKSDNFMGGGERLAWVSRVFCACVWHDATVVQYQAFRLKDIRRNEARVEKPKHKNKTLVLPRVIRQMEWRDEDFDRYSHTVRAHNVRAHYRKLPEGASSSPKAAEQAERCGFPEPPDGFTFVRPYAVGIALGDEPPQVVCRGLQVARVALSRI